MLLVNGTKAVCGFIRGWAGRYIRAVFLLLAGTAIVGSMVMTIFSFDTPGAGRVYAVSASEKGSEEELQVQAGLRGVVGGVSLMERYSKITKLVSIADSYDEILAGARGLNKSAIQKNHMQKGVQKAAALSYYVQQTVEQNQMSSEEYDTLLHIVEAEATGGDLMSKMIVAGVVLNRVKDSYFPDTIYEVVWQEDQFQPTADGRIYSCTVTQSTIDAVERVLQGEDYSQGALFFFARNSSASDSVDWFDSSLIPIFEYGGHEYFTFRENCE